MLFPTKANLLIFIHVFLSSKNVSVFSVPPCIYILVKLLYFFMNIVKTNAVFNIEY